MDFKADLERAGYRVEENVEPQQNQDPISAIGFYVDTPYILCGELPPDADPQTSAIMWASAAYSIHVRYGVAAPFVAWVRVGDQDFFYLYSKTAFLNRLPKPAELSDDLSHQTAIWREKPVDMRTFICGQRFLDLEGLVYPNILRIACAFDEPHIRDGKLLIGKGGGKSTLTSILIARSIYKVMCLRDWRRVLKIPVGNIYTLNMATTKEQARDVLFSKFTDVLKRSQWFRGKYVARKDRIAFRGGIESISGSSSDTAQLGYDIFCGVLDEADFFLDTSHKSNADNLYSVLEEQSRTRFGDWRKVFVISSLGKSVNSFMIRQWEAMKKNGRPRKDILLTNSMVEGDIAVGT